MDRVRLEGLVLEAGVGVYDFERGIRQRLEVDVTAHIDLAPPGSTDDVADTLDYDGIAQLCRSVVEARHHDLIESIAAEIADGVLQGAPAVVRVEVRVAKPGAIPDAKNVAVEIDRSRP